MGYYNPVLAYGEDRAIEEAAAAGANGFIAVHVSEIADKLCGMTDLICTEVDLFLATRSLVTRINRIQLGTWGN